MAPGGKPSCLTTLPAVRHCQSQCEPTDLQTHFGCRTIAARTRDLILEAILAVTNSYSTVPVLLWDLGSLTCESA